MKLHQIRHLLLILSLFTCKSFVNAELADLSFEIKGEFSCGTSGNVFCNGNATTTEEGLLKLLPDPNRRQESWEYYKAARGSALYKTPLQVLDRSTKNAVSFSASFSFQIELDQSLQYTPGDGMAFVLFPSELFMGSDGANLGAYIESPVDQVGTVLAVEFDTYLNSWDFENVPNDMPAGSSHVGINVNIAQSLKAKAVSDFDMVKEKRVFAWVDYDSTVPSLEVRVSTTSARPKGAFLTYAIHLSDAFGNQEQAWVGFSAANGVYHSFYTVHDLTFTSGRGSLAMLGTAPATAPAENLSPLNKPRLAPAPQPLVRSPWYSPRLAPEPAVKVPPSYPPRLAAGPAPARTPNLSFYINNEFRCGSNSKANMFCNGNATSTNDGLLKLLPDPKGRNESSAYYKDAVGTALFREPVRLLDHSAGRAASFSANFSFNIEVDTKDSPGDGLAFVLLPNSSYLGQSGEHLGVLLSPDEDQTGGTVLAVEFDTFFNLNDETLTANHVGFDVDYTVSRVGSPLTEFNLTAAKRVYSWVDHDCTVPLLEVRVSTKPDRPKKAFITYELDLFDVLGEQELAYVGFSSANGAKHGFVNVHDVSFTSSLESPPYRSLSIPATTPPVPAPLPEVDTRSPASQPYPEVISSRVMTPAAYPNPQYAAPASSTYSIKLNPNLLTAATFCTFLTTLLVSHLLV